MLRNNEKITFYIKLHCDIQSESKTNYIYPVTARFVWKIVSELCKQTVIVTLRLLSVYDDKFQTQVLHSY